MASSASLLRAVRMGLAAVFVATAAGAQPVRLVASDARGVTLRVDASRFALGPANPQGRTALLAAGMHEHHEPGRAILPFAQALIALPPGAQAVARIVDAAPETVREGVRLPIGEKSLIKEDPTLGGIAASEPVPAILDGPWPTTGVEVGTPFELRRQRMVAVRIEPFRYDEASGRLWNRPTMTIRVDFTGTTATEGAPAAADRHWEPVFRSALLNYEQGRRWRAPARPARVGTLFPRGGIGRPAPTAAGGVGAFDEDHFEVRVRVDTTGLYGLDFDQLGEAGYPTGVPIGEVSVHRHEYVPDAIPSYVTIELPIEVVDANPNGVFDSGDYVQLFVQNWAERSGASLEQRQWGDGEAIFVTRLTSRPALRMPTRPGWRNATLVPLASYPWTQRWERNFAYINAPNDTTVTDRFQWTGIVPYYVRPDTFPFQVNHIDTTHAVSVQGFWQGRRNSVPNFLWALTRNGAGQTTSIVDSVLWFGKDAYTATRIMNGSAFTEGATNSLRMWGKSSSQPPNPTTNAAGDISFNAFETTYWRQYRALNGYLSTNSADATGAFQIRGLGFTSTDIRVYDVTDPTAPVRLDVDPSHILPAGGGRYTIDFQDSVDVAGRRRYFVVDNPHILPPDRYAPVTRRNLAGSAADYLIVVPEAFLTAAAPLATLHQAQGLSVLVAPLESVNDEFNGGRKSKHAIKRFVRHAFENWNARFLLLVGDGSEDGRHVFNDSGIDWVPAPMIRGPVSQADGGLEVIPSDPWYGWCFNGDDDGCFSSSPPMPDVFVGRLPANSVQQVTDMVGKLTAYDNLSGDQTWRRRMLLLADDAYSGVNTFGGGGSTAGYCFRDYELRFRTLNQSVRSVVLDEAGLVQSEPDVLDVRSYLTTPSLYIVNGVGDTCRTGTTFGTPNAKSILASTFNPELFSRLNAGVLWWNFQGHANQYVLGHEEFYVNKFAEHSSDFLLNAGRPFLFSAFSCHANGFAKFNEADPATGISIGEDMLVRGDRGAVASWASTGYEIIPSNGTYHLNVEMARSMFSTPPHDDLLGNGDVSARVVLGEAIALTLLNYLPSVAGYTFERGVGLTYNVLGDPATRLSIGPPQIQVTANGQPVVDGEPVRLASQGDTLRIEADLVSNVALASITLERTDAGGTTVVAESLYTLSPAFPDTAAAGLGGRAYHLVYRTSLTTGAFRYTIRTVDRWGVAAKFDIVFAFETVLQAEGVTVRDGDTVSPTARLTLLVLSPNVIDPQADLELTIDGTPQAFTATPLRGDVTGRQFVLAWNHTPYAAGRHEVALALNGTPAALHAFQVVGGARFRNAMAFPNPFEDELGTQFTFDLDSESPADLLIKVYTATGRLVYQRVERGLQPGHHQLAWDGRDAEGEKLANGIYFFRMVAHTASDDAVHEGRLVKLRKPHRIAEVTPTP